MRDAAVAGAVLPAVVDAGSGYADSAPDEEPRRCPYFDQPMYCDGLSEDGKPLCTG